MLKHDIFVGETQLKKGSEFFEEKKISNDFANLISF